MSTKEKIQKTLAEWLYGPPALAPLRDARQPLVLFLSRTNTATSIMAEAILEQSAEGRLRAASAGDKPAGARVNPYALECLRTRGIATRGLRSKPWGEFFGLNRAPVRFLITLAEVEAFRANWELDSPLLVRARWPMPDPTDVAGSDSEVRQAFERAFATLEFRIRKFLTLPLTRLTDQILAAELALIGQEEGK